MLWSEIIILSGCFFNLLKMFNLIFLKFSSDPTIGILCIILPTDFALTEIIAIIL